MGTEFEDTGKNVVKKPQVFLKSVTFNDDVQLMLKQNSIKRYRILFRSI